MVDILITRDVSADLCYPVTCVVALLELRETLFEIAAVPEVAVAEDHDAVLREDYIRPTGQPRNMKAVAKTSTPEFAPKHKLATRVGLGASAASGLRGLARSWSQPFKGWRRPVEYRGHPCTALIKGPLAPLRLL
jgi:hypothetical protein